MSALDLALPEPAAAIPFSVRLAERRAIARVTATKTPDRRAHRRRAAAELTWLELVRLTGGTGFEVSLIDLSEGGALIEVDAPLRPGSQLTLELSGQGLEARVPLQVLRSYIATLCGGAAMYRGACVFVHPIDLPGVTAAPPPKPGQAFIGTDAALSYLLKRSGDAPEPGVVSLERAEILHVLESIHARSRRDGDPLGREAMTLLGSILPALQAGVTRDAALTALDERMRQVPPEMRSELRSTCTQLTALIERCMPAAPAPARTVPRPQKETAFQKIVVRYADGRLLKGFTQDFHPSRPQFSLWPTIDAAPADRVIVPTPALKAVFFVKDFDGNPGYRERKTFTVRGQGRRLEVTFLDTEVVLGTTLNYRPDAQGFFVIPADPGTNNSRIFVVAGAVKRVRFL
jgi:PilZ domain